MKLYRACMLPKDTDTLQVCLLVALEIFFKIFKNIDSLLAMRLHCTKLSKAGRTSY